MEKLDIWIKVRKKIKAGVRNNFTEIRKLIGYKNEESIGELLGLTRQTLSKFGICSDAYEDNTPNALLLSVIALMDNFLYENRFDIDNRYNYIDKLDSYFFSEIFRCEELCNEIKNIDPLYFFMDDNVEGRYIKRWLDTFKYEKLISEKEYIDINYREPTIRQIVINYHIYVLSDFLVTDNAEKFLEKLILILLNKGKKIRVSNFTIDEIQNSRLSSEGNIYQNSLKALKRLQVFKEEGKLQIINSNPNSKNEVELVKNEIYKLDKKNAIVFTQNNIYEILQINHYGIDCISNFTNTDFKVLCLKLNGNQEINFEKRIGYEIYHELD